MYIYIAPDGNTSLRKRKGGSYIECPFQNGDICMVLKKGADPDIHYSKVSDFEEPLILNLTQGFVGVLWSWHSEKFQKRDNFQKIS